MTGPHRGERHPATARLLRWFDYDHLPPHLQAVARPIHAVAHELVDQLPDGPELSAGLRHLLEGKDCMVRAAIEVREQLDAHRPTGPIDPPRPAGHRPVG